MQIVSCLDFTNVCFWNIFVLIFSLVGCVPCIGALVTGGAGSILAAALGALGATGTVATTPFAITGIPIAIGVGTITIGSLTIPSAALIGLFGGPFGNILCSQVAAIGEATCDFLIHYPIDVQAAFTANWFNGLIESAILLIGYLIGMNVSEEGASNVATGIIEYLKPIWESITASS